MTVYVVLTGSSRLGRSGGAHSSRVPSRDHSASSKPTAHIPPSSRSAAAAASGYAATPGSGPDGSRNGSRGQPDGAATGTPDAQNSHKQVCWPSTLFLFLSAFCKKNHDFCLEGKSMIHNGRYCCLQFLPALPSYQSQPLRGFFNLESALRGLSTTPHVLLSEPMILMDTV